MAALAAVEVEPDAPDEDVHSAIERLLGDLGPRVHAGRSRNDQVQTAMRLWVKAGLRRGVAARARAGHGAGRPRRAPTATRCCPATPTASVRSRCGWASTWPPTAGRSPATCGGWPQVRDAADVLPAGRGSAGRLEPAARPRLGGAELGFASRFENPLDAVSDRDYVSGLCYAAALCMVHLSRIAEELVLWTSAEYGFAELDDSAATGSSMMPQKKNPDAAELTRGKAGTAIGRLAGLLATLKGLPLAYNRDLQEDKRAAFDQVDDLLGALAALTVCVRGLRFDPSGWRRRPATARTVATDVAEQLVREGVPFREAHAQVAARVAAGERFGEPTRPRRPRPAPPLGAGRAARRCRAEVACEPALAGSQRCRGRAAAGRRARPPTLAGEFGTPLYVYDERDAAGAVRGPTWPAWRATRARRGRSTPARRTPRSAVLARWSRGGARRRRRLGRASWRRRWRRAPIRRRS